MKSIRNLMLSGLLVAGLPLAMPAQAASVQCSTVVPDATNSVIANDGCELLTSANNDSDTAVDGMFGVADWKSLGKVESDPFVGGSDGGLTITGDGQTGTWKISQSVLDQYAKVMLIFKGATNAVPETVIGYLVSDAEGTYTTPFFKSVDGDNGVQPQNISHVTLYAQVPLPAAGFLLIGAMAGLGLVGRRKRIS